MKKRKENSMRYTVIGVIFIFMASAALSFGHTRPQLAGEVSLEIVTDSNSTFRIFSNQHLWRGQTRIIKKYLEAKKGENYVIVIRNNSPERIGVVIAVDGRNIISGSRTDLKNSETMYIVNP